MVKVAVTSRNLARNWIDAGICWDFRSLEDPIRVIVVHLVADVVQFPPVASGDDVHTAVGHGGVVQSDPASRKLGRSDMIPIGVVPVPCHDAMLVPGSLADRLVFPYSHWPSHQVVGQRADRRVADHLGKHAIMTKEVGDFSELRVAFDFRIGYTAQVIGIINPSVENTVSLCPQAVDLLVGKNACSRHVSIGSEKLNLVCREMH